MKVKSTMFGLWLGLTALPARADITSDLIAHWKFDETTGAIATDSSGNGNHATLYNFELDDSMWVEGRLGGALQFNPVGTGDDDQVLTDAPLILSNQDSFTFAFWARRQPGDNPFNPRFITPVGDQHWVLWTPGTGVGFYVPAPTQDPPIGAWRHFVVLFDRGASSYSVYVDGQKVVDNVAAARPEPGEAQWVIGHKEILTDHRDPWRGFLDDLRMYNRVLSDADVQELYAEAGAVPPNIVTAPQPISKFLGDTVTLTVVAEGTGPLLYQWYKGGELLEGETGPSLVIADAQVADSGIYHVTVSNSVTTVESAPAEVEVTDPPVDIVSNLLLHYEFDETSGLVVTDSSGKGNHGTINLSTGDNSEWVPGRIGGAVQLNPEGGGNDDYIITDGFVALENQDQFTFTFWANAAPGSGVNPRIITPTTGHWVLWTPGTGVGFYVPAASPEPVQGLWRHFAVVYDRPAGIYQLFVDGVRTGSEVGGRVRVPAGDSQWILGHSESLAALSDAFAGALDDVRLYNRILSAKDIAAIHALAPERPPVIVSAPDDLIISSGSSLNLTVLADGTSLTYQWKRNGEDIAGATQSTLVLSELETADSGEYTVVVKNSLDEVTSEPAEITVIPTLDLRSAPVQASAEYNTDFTASKAFDKLRLSTGPNSSRWASPADSSFHWIWVDLGEDMNIKQVLLDWEAAYGVDFVLRGRTEEEGLSEFPHEWTDLASVYGYSQTGHGVDGADVIFDFAADTIQFQGDLIAEPAVYVTVPDPTVRYLMIDGQFASLTLFSIWEIEVNGEPANPRPQLSVSRSSTSITISWPETVSGFVLETAGELPSAQWEPVAAVANNQVTIEADGTRFYRLARE